MDEPNYNQNNMTQEQPTGMENIIKNQSQQPGEGQMNQQAQPNYQQPQAPPVYQPITKKQQKQLDKLRLAEQKRLMKEQKKKDKLIKPKKDFNFIWKITTGLFGFATLGLFGALIFKKGTYAWMGASFTFLLLFVLLFIFLIYIGKKTHAMLEFKAMMSGKPISLFFTDHKRIEWRVLEPEGNIIVDKKHGAFLINEKGAYVDKKTKNIFLAFNPAIATNASVESFKITDTLNTVLKDEKKLGLVRHALMEGTMDGSDVVFNGADGQEERLTSFDRLRENVDFSHLKSLLNTLIPHAINSKIEMTVQQRLGGLGKVNYAQAILVVVSIIGAVTLAIILLKMYGGGGGTTTVVKETVRTVVQNASVVTG